MLGANSKTTILGIVTILGSVLGALAHILQGQPVDWAVTMAAVMSGIGLITAKDYNVTGGTKPNS